MQDAEKWYSMKEMVEYIGVSRETILNWIEKRGMPATKMGRLWKFKKNEVDDWVKAKNRDCSNQLQQPTLNFINISSPPILEIFFDLHFSTDKSIKEIKSLLSICLHGLARDIDILTVNLSNEEAQIGFSIEEMDEMANEALCYYLLLWLKNADNTRQKISSFAKQKFTPKERPKVKGSPIASERKYISRHLQEYYHTKPNASTSGKKEHDFIALCWPEFYASGLSLFKDLVNHQKDLEIIGKSNRNVMIDGYNDYFNAFIEIGNEEDKLTQVAKALFFYEFEMSYRFLFSYQIATALDKYKVVSLDQIINQIDVYFQEIPWGENLPDWNFASIRYVDTLIEMACSNKITEPLRTKITISRLLIQGAIKTLIDLKPEWLKRSWTDKDFADAANFLFVDYKFKDLETFNWNYIDDDENHIKEDKLRDVYLKLIDNQRLSSFKEKNRKQAQKHK